MEETVNTRYRQALVAQTAKESHLLKKEEPLWRLERTSCGRRGGLSSASDLWASKRIAEFPVFSVLVGAPVQFICSHRWTHGVDAPPNILLCLPKEGLP